MRSWLELWVNFMNYQVVIDNVGGVGDWSCRDYLLLIEGMEVDSLGGKGVEDLFDVLATAVDAGLHFKRK